LIHYLHKAYLNTTTEVDILDATHDVKRAFRDSLVLNGLLTVYLPGTVAGVVILENDPSLRKKFKEFILSLVPSSLDGARPVRKSGTGRDAGHLQASLLHTSLSIPIKEGRLFLGPWQEVIVFDFDDKIGRREILITVMGDGAEEKKKPA